MRRRLGPSAAAICLVLAATITATIVAALGISTAATAADAATAATSGPTQAPPPLQKAYVLVDADTGAVLAQQDAHTVRPPASTIKLLTALVAVQRLKPTDAVPISALADGMPARKINVKAGQVWRTDDLLRSMLMVSANDAAV